MAAIKARGSNAGRAAIDPHILFALWLYATLDGVGSGREVARLAQQHDAYHWICGGVSVNYHALNDFRSGNEVLMDELLTDNVAALAAAGAIALKRVAQDGMRVRADGDSPAVASWRVRMASDEAKEIYKQRAATAECVNAQARGRGLQRMPVRGLAKVRSVVGLFVLAHNLMRMAALAPQLIGGGRGASAMAAQAV